MLNTKQLERGARRLTWLAALVLSACGGGNVADDSTKTASSAAADSSADARQRAQAAPSSLAVKVTTAPDALLQNLTIPADAATRGMWSTIQKWPLNAAHLALLPDGKVLSYGTAPGQPNVPNGRSFDFWTPSAGFGTAAHRLVSTPNGADTFGSSAAERKDGDLVIVGGVSTRSTTLVRWATGEVVDEGSALHDDRWYSTALTQPDGTVYVVAGMTANSEAVVLGNGTAGSVAGVRSWHSEVLSSPAFSLGKWIWGQGDGDFQPLLGSGLNSASPQVWVSPRGEPFGLAGPLEWHHHFPDSRPWTPAVGEDIRKGLSSAPYGALAAAAMVRPGQILIAGGRGSNANDGAAASAKTVMLDINVNYDPNLASSSSTPFGVKPIELPSMAFARRMANATLLANGQLVVTGGTSLGNAADASAVRAAEVFDPVLRTWSTAASAGAARVHHSAALLLPNGTVLTTGGGVMTDAGREDAEVFYPPYLFRTVNGSSQLAPRPVLTGINALNFALGGAVKVELAAGHKAARLLLVRAGTVSRGFNNGQRPIELAFTQSGDTVSTTMPFNPNLAPPGHYLLHVLDAAGVPSAAQIVGLGLDGSTRALLPVFEPETIVSIRSVVSPELIVAGQGSVPATLLTSAPSQAVPDAGKLILETTENLLTSGPNATCYRVRQQALTGGTQRWLVTDAASATTYNWSTIEVIPTSSEGATRNERSVICLEPAPTGRGFLLRPVWDPSKVLRVVNGKLRLEFERATAAFMESAAFDIEVLQRSSRPFVPRLNVTPATLPKSMPFGTRVKIVATTFARSGSETLDIYACGDPVARKHLVGASNSAGTTLSFDWMPGVGTRCFTVRATDTFFGFTNSVTSPTFVVLPNTLPTVSLTAPSNGSVLVTGQSISLTSQASDADGPLKRVEFFDGTKLIGTASASPWSVTWTPTAGSHTLTAKAFDNSDVSTTSAPAVVTAAP